MKVVLIFELLIGGDPSMAMKNTKLPNIDGWPPILRLYFKVIGGPPVTGTPVGSRTAIRINV